MITMKYLFIILLLNVSIVFGFAQKKISVLNDQLIFYVQNEIIIESELTFSSFREEEDYLDGKIGVWIGVSNEESIKKQGGWQFSPSMENLLKNKNLNKKSFLSLLKPSVNFAFSSIGYNRIESTYALVRYNGIFIGEAYGSDGAVDAEPVVPPYHGYLIDLVVGDNIVHIRIMLHDEKENIARQMPEYFFYNSTGYNCFIWKYYKQSRVDLYRKLYSDNYKELPIVFQKLRETFDLILNTLSIPEYTSFDSYITETALRLRANANTTSDIVVTIPKNARVRLLEEGKIQIIDGIAAKWIKVETEDGKEGWCFSGYLKPRNDAATVFS